MLCCYTDGLVEQENARNAFGTERLATLLQEHEGQTLEDIHQEIVNALRRSVGRPHGWTTQRCELPLQVSSLVLSSLD